MRNIITASLALASLSACATQSMAPVTVAAAPPSMAATPVLPEPVPLSELVKAVDIPYTQFVLANGLTTLVHTDRKAPIVGVTLYYRVGSKHEPKGRTGFAHLYEHLFFGGSENVPNFDVPLEAAGSGGTNGSTWYDRTNYVETVPKGALELALFIESDRMGHLLGAVTQDKLDKQRAVVQNEKRQGDNQPYGLGSYVTTDALFPVGHPYRHSTIGSMADLNAASLIDVRKWFADNYGPNNVVLALTGDIDAESARPLVEKYFGNIPRGPDVPKVLAGPVTLAASISRDITDQVPVLKLTRNWSGPGQNDADNAALTLGMHVLGGLASSRLDNALVRGDKLAVSVTAGLQSFEQVSLIGISMDVKPGVDRAKAEARLDAIIADFIAKGPSEDELRRAATGFVSGQIDGLEQVGGFGGKGANLAEGLLFSGDPAQYKKDLARLAAVTPDQVRSAMQKWLSRPVVALATVPGVRTEKGDEMGGWGDEATSPAPKADAKRAVPRLAKTAPRIAPSIAPVGDLVVPSLEHAVLSNGIPITLARRTAIPKVSISLDFDAGIAADSLDMPGTQAMMMGMLDEGTTSRDATQIAEEQERLGAGISTGTGIDSSSIGMTTLSANLPASLALMSDIARNPALADSEVARVKEQHLAGLAQTMANPQGIAGRALTGLLFGSHPYGQPSDGLGDAKSIAALSPAALRAAHNKWLRPDLARITVVGDSTMAQLLPQLEAAFGSWKNPAAPKPVKNLAAPVPAPRARILVIDRPNSPQSVIYGGRVLPLTGTTLGLEPLDLANEVLGGGFLSRLNLDLREEKGWSYGVGSGVRSPIGPRTFIISAPVQADRTGDAIRALLADIKAFSTNKGVQAEELNRVTDGKIRSLPNAFETNGQVLGALVGNARLNRPDDYLTTLPARIRSVDAKAIDTAARTYLQADQIAFVVVGDRKLIEPQLKGIGLPVEFAPAPDSGN